MINLSAVVIAFLKSITSVRPQSLGQFACEIQCPIAEAPFFNTVAKKAMKSNSRMRPQSLGQVAGEIQLMDAEAHFFNTVATVAVKSR